MSGWQNPPPGTIGVTDWVAGLRAEERCAQAELAAARLQVEWMMVAEALVARFACDPAVHYQDREALYRLQKAAIWVDQVRARLEKATLAITACDDGLILSGFEG